MSPDLKAGWSAALRSGKYTQGKGFLMHGDKHCALGVLHSVFRRSQSDSFAVSWPQLRDLGLTSNEANRVVAMSEAGKSFPEIADYIDTAL